jgi:fructose-specific phosphotransferase system IIA component
VKELHDLLQSDAIFFDLAGADKFDVIHQIIQRMSSQPAVENAAIFEEEVLRREKEIPTGLLFGAALPHARSKAVSDIVMAFARLDKGVNFSAQDKKKARLIFLFGVPNTQINEYLKLVARLCRLLKSRVFRQNLLAAQTPQEVIKLLQEV